MTLKSVFKKITLIALCVSSVTFTNTPHGVSVFSFSTVLGYESTNTTQNHDQVNDPKKEKIHKYIDLAAWTGVATINYLVFNQISSLAAQKGMDGTLTIKDCIPPLLLTGSLYTISYRFLNKVRA